MLKRIINDLLKQARNSVSRRHNIPRRICFHGPNVGTNSG